MVSVTAYLVQREGAKWNEVFRLIPGQTVSIGRASSNRIVVKDELCSRVHAEVYYSEMDSCWLLRDLHSRNGTGINGIKIDPELDAPLSPKDTIQIGKTQFLFLYDLNEVSQAPKIALGTGATTLPAVSLPNAFKKTEGEKASGNVLDGYGSENMVSVLEDSHVLSRNFSEDTMITYRQDKARLLDVPVGDVAGQKAPGQRIRNYVSSLCRLAMEINCDVDKKTKLEMVLKYLLYQLPLDTAGVLLLPADYHGLPDISQLETVIAMSTSAHSYQRVSDFLAKTVLETGDAVLARHVMGDSILGRRDSTGVVDATSVICAPIRSKDYIWGIIHMYSTDKMNVPDELDLDFTLGVSEVLAVTLENLAQQQKLAASLTQVRSENDDLRKRLGVQSDIIGSSQAIIDITEQIVLAANSRATVLIRGESGVGKELVARAVHYSSVRNKKPFITLNCAALSEDLLASELFGHERGAFTGATERKIGKFEAAEGGSLMLDEIGEMSLNIQAKFLRVLEGHPFERVGGNKPIRADVRVIAATNRDLEQEVMEGRFRRDLFFRLRVLEIFVPPLRQRKEDILGLAQHFFQMFRDETGRKLEGFTPQALQRLVEYDWPGNVRELKNMIERAVVLARGTKIDEADLILSNLMVPSDGDSEASTILLEAGNLARRTREHIVQVPDFLPCSLEEMEAEHIRKMLDFTEGNKSKAAQMLKIERTTLDRKIKKYGLEI
ncbi:MAG: sigma 54-interacting transcriptional regulator [Planctomycetia bacterium]|nr:sigma 54-interacting transcriptional regulator [Planctomycetia bacterium]